MSALAAALAALAVWLLLPPPARLIPVRSATRRGRGRQVGPVLALAAAAAAAGAQWAGIPGLLWGLIADVVGLTALWLVKGSRGSRARRIARQDVAHATQVIAGQLRIGALPVAALAQAAKDSPALERAAATQAIGGDVARALQDASMAPGREGLASLARAWRLGESSGAPVASLAEQVSEQVRRDHATQQMVEAELAGPRATSKLLLALPALGVLMGRFAGGDPVRFLTTTLVGQLCLLVGVGLAAAGTLWIEHMANAVQEV